MKLVFGAFKGELPILDPRLLPEQNAQTARNVYLRRGTLKPEKGTTAVGITAVANPSTLWRYPNGNNGNGYWLTWGDDVHVVKSPLANDDWQRVYWTGDGVPKVAGIDKLTTGSPPYPGASWRLGVPAPGSRPQVNAPSGRVSAGNYPDEALETSYVVTMVTAYGEEGPPSLPSGIITRWDMVSGAPAGGNVVVTLPAIPSGNYDIDTKRIYRVESGGLYQFVADVPASTNVYTDAVKSEALGIAIPSDDWDPPPSNLTGLTAMPNGILAGFFGNTLCFCEPYRPHAWPVGYQLAFEEDIVAIASTGPGLVVVTQGQPYLVTGSSPAAMAPMELDVQQRAVSARSLVDMGDFAIYASHDGLIAIGGQQAEVITRGVISKAQWQALNPETIHGYRYDGRYIAFYDGGCLAFTPGEGLEFYTIEADAGYYDIADDVLYLVQDGDIASWGTGSDLTYTWRSKVSEIPRGAASFSCGQVIAYDYPVTLRIYADGDTVIDQAIQNSDMFRLPAGYTEARDWEVEISSTHEVASVQISTSPGELV